MSATSRAAMRAAVEDAKHGWRPPARQPGDGLVSGPYARVVDGPFGPPLGAGCEPTGDRLRSRRVSTRRVEAGASLGAVLPEFTRPLFGRC